MKTKDPEELLREYDCLVIKDDVYFEKRYAVNAMQSYAEQQRTFIMETIQKRCALYAKIGRLDICCDLDEIIAELEAMKL